MTPNTKYPIDNRRIRPVADENLCLQHSKQHLNVKTQDVLPRKLDARIF